jgi:hypothetical protein
MSYGGIHKGKALTSGVGDRLRESRRMEIALCKANIRRELHARSLNEWTLD